MSNKRKRHIKKDILKFSSQCPTLYNLVFFVLFFLLLTATSFLPYIYRAVVYPVFYDKEERTGVIEAVYIQNNEVAGKHNRSDMPIYYFSVNDTMVRVTPSSFREYKRGDVFEYYQYIRGDKVIGDSREYMLGWGLSMLIIYILLAVVAWVYFTAESEEDTGRRKVILKNRQRQKNFKKMSVKELYELCIEKKIDIPNNKRKKRAYLERCLRDDHEKIVHTREWKWQQIIERGIFHNMIIIFYIISVILVCIGYARFIYHFIYLFT